MSKVFAEHLAEIQEKNYSAIASRFEQGTWALDYCIDDGRCRFQTSGAPPDDGDIRAYWGLWNEETASLTMSMLVDVAAPIPKLGLTHWLGTGLFGSQPLFVHDVVLFTDWGDIRNNVFYAYSDGVGSQGTDDDKHGLEQSSAGTTVGAMRNSFLSSWEASNRTDFVNLFAEEAQMMIYDDCPETDKVVSFQGRDGAGLLFDRFLDGTSPLPTGGSSGISGTFGNAGVFSIPVLCGPNLDVLCLFSHTVVLAESDTGELKILFSLGSWGRWRRRTGQSISTCVPRQRSAQLRD